MAKEKFERLQYVGPSSSFSVVTKSQKGKPPETKSRPLTPGRIYDDLPSDHPVIMNLCANRLLVEPDDDAPEASPEETMADSNTATSGDNKKGTSK